MQQHNIKTNLPRFPNAQFLMHGKQQDHPIVLQQNKLHLPLTHSWTNEIKKQKIRELTYTKIRKVYVQKFCRSTKMKVSLQVFDTPQTAQNLTHAIIKYFPVVSFPSIILGCIVRSPFKNIRSRKTRNQCDKTHHDHK